MSHRPCQRRSLFLRKFFVRFHQPNHAVHGVFHRFHAVFPEPESEDVAHQPVVFLQEDIDIFPAKAVQVFLQQGVRADAGSAGDALGTGEALVSFLDEEGRPMIVEKAKILPPQCLMAQASDEVIAGVLEKQSKLMAKYGEAFDRNKVYFYTALEYKRMLGIRSTAFKGSRVLGFFVGKGRIIPVYRTNHDLRTFSKQEALLPFFMQQFFSIPVSEAILICNDERSVINITKQIIANTGSDDKGINTAKYKKFYIFSSGDSFYSRFEDLYNNHSALLQRLIEQNYIETTNRDKEGNYRLLIGTGFYRNNPVWFCPGNIDAVTLRLFARNARINEKMNYILCQERDVDTLKKIVENSSLSVWPIREG